MNASCNSLKDEQTINTDAKGRPHTRLLQNLRRMLETTDDWEVAQVPSRSRLLPPLADTIARAARCYTALLPQRHTAECQGDGQL